MKTPQLASCDSVRIFYHHEQHIALVLGKKPPHAEVNLVEARRHGASSLSLQLTAPPDCPSILAPTDSYYLVMPILHQEPSRRQVHLTHAGGRQWVPVESLPMSDEHLSRAHATGFSQNFQLDEAFHDALRQLPCLQGAPGSDPITMVDMVAMGAFYGGFSGFSRLFVRLEQTATSMAAPTSLAQKLSDLKSHIRSPKR